MVKMQAQKNAGQHGGAELVEKLVYVGRCVKVVKGGRRFRFSAIVVVGDRRGRVGVGLGKANEVVEARMKASRLARRNVEKISLRNGRTLHYDINSKFCSGQIIMKTAPAGTGIIAGGPVRPFFEVLGIKDIVVKSIRSTNPHNMIAAALKGLRSVNTPRFVAEKRGKRISELFGSKKGDDENNIFDKSKVIKPKD